MKNEFYMKLWKLRRSIFVSTIYLGFVLVLLSLGCKKEEPVTITAEDFIVTIDENPTDGQVLGTINVTSNQKSLQFTLSSENPVGALEINSSSGELRVADRLLFDFEKNPVITATVAVSKDEITDYAQVTINLVNIADIWTGPKIIFTKGNYADFTLGENQDRITDEVWLTRASTQGLYNIAKEASYEDYFSPECTEWAFGTTENFENLIFDTWEDTNESMPPSMVNRDMVLHIICGDIYIDIKFLSWTTGGMGGGFSYERSTQ